MDVNFFYYSCQVFLENAELLNVSEPLLHICKDVEKATDLGNKVVGFLIMFYTILAAIVVTDGFFWILLKLYKLYWGLRSKYGWHPELREPLVTPEETKI